MVAVALFSFSSSEAATKYPETKIIIQAMASEDYPADAPCFIVYPSNESREMLKALGTAQDLEQSLEKLGYQIVKNESEAAVFIRVYYERFEPYDAMVQLNKRPTIDYSNASSTRNYAAMMKGGRYQKLANPTLARDRNEVGALLGPSGEVIMLSEQEPNAPKVIKKDPELIKTTVYPIVFEISAWQFPQDDDDPQPQQIWATLATYNNLKEEEIEPQLQDLYEATSRFYGKALSGEKLVRRK